MNWKMIIICFLAFLLVPFGSAFAASNYGMNENEHYMVFESGSSTFVAKFNSPSDSDYFYKGGSSSNSFYASGSVTVYKINTDGSLSYWDSYSANSMFWSGSITIKEASIDVYNDQQKTSFFLRVTSPVQQVKAIPQMMMKALVDGGILSVALMGFAILLAVGLIPRLKSWFLRSN